MQRSGALARGKAFGIANNTVLSYSTVDSERYFKNEEESKNKKQSVGIISH